MNHLEHLYVPLEPRFLRPGRLGRLGGWEADVKVPIVVFGIPIYTFRATIPDAWDAGRLGAWLAGWLAGGFKLVWLVSWLAA